jgi:hypothetical protein
MNINPAITMQNGIAPRGGASSVFVFLDEQKKDPSASHSHHKTYQQNKRKKQIRLELRREQMTQA